MSDNNPTWAEALAARKAVLAERVEAIEDEILLDEVARRIARDSGVRYDLSDVLAALALTVDDLEPDTPRRLWVLGRGSWLTPRCSTNPDGSVKDFLPAPPVFLGGDEFGNRPLCVRLPGHRLMCLNWRIPLLRELYDPDKDTP